MAIPLAAPFVTLLKKPAAQGFQKEQIIVEKVTNPHSTPYHIKLPDDAFDIVLGENVLKQAKGYLLLPRSTITYKKQQAMPDFVLLGPIQGFSIVMKCALFLGALLAAPF